jgi:hypothetical protein
MDGHLTDYAPIFQFDQLFNSSQSELQKFSGTPPGPSFAEKTRRAIARAHARGDSRRSCFNSAEQDRESTITHPEKLKENDNER